MAAQTKGKVMTSMLDEDDDGLPAQRAGFDDKTAWGRINGRDRRRYARLWGVDLDRPREDLPNGEALPSGEEEFNLYVKMMSCDHSVAEGYRPGGKSLPHRHVDEEEFAAAWRPMTESEMLDEIIAERIAALGGDAAANRRPRESDDESSFEARDPDSDPESHH
jgi:hypothetical protein